MSDKAIRLANREDADIVRAPGHGPDESARWYTVLHGTYYRIPQPTAESLEMNWQARQEERQEELQETLEGSPKVEAVGPESLLERIMDRLREGLWRLREWLRGTALGVV